MLPEIERFQKWLRRKAPRASTHIHYTNDLEIFFAWLKKPPSDVKVPDVDAFIDHAYQQQHCPATINRRLAALSSFYHFLAVESASAPRNPVVPKRHYISLGEQLPRDIQDSLVEKLFGVICDARDRAMFLLMLRCGLRVSEVRNLTTRDLYLEPSVGSLPRIWLHGKGSKERVVYLSSQPLAALRVWLNSRPKTQDEAVFLNRFGHKMSVTAIQKRLGVYSRQAGIWVTCHQLRHTFGRHLTEARTPLTSIQRMLGHSHLRTTEIYLHISDSQVQEDYEAAIEVICKTLPLDKVQP